MSKKTARTAAYHEAGHAVVSILLGHPVEKVELFDDDPERFGASTNDDDPAFAKGIKEGGADFADAVPHVMILFAGPLAERMYSGRWNGTGARLDLRTVADVCAAVTGDEGEAGAFARWVRERTRVMLRLPAVWAAVRRVAGELSRRRALARRDLQSLLRDRNGVAMSAAEAHLARIERRARRGTGGGRK